MHNGMLLVLLPGFGLLLLLHAPCPNRRMTGSGVSGDLFVFVVSKENLSHPWNKEIWSQHTIEHTQTHERTFDDRFSKTLEWCWLMLLLPIFRSSSFTTGLSRPIFRLSDRMDPVDKRTNLLSPCGEQDVDSISSRSHVGSPNPWTSDTFLKCVFNIIFNIVILCKTQEHPDSPVTYVML